MNTKRPRVLVQMNRLAAYRVPVFNLLSEQVDLDVACFGTNGRIENVRFNFIQGKPYKFGPFVYNRFRADIAEYDVVITGFDARNLNSYYYAIAHSGKTILYSLGYGKSLLAALMRRAFHKRTAATLTYTQATAQQLIKTGVPAEKVFFTGNTVQVGHAPERPRRSFLNVGTPKPRKKVEDVLMAMAMARDKLPRHVRLVLVGKDVEKAYGATAVRHGVADLVEFHDEVRDENKLAGYFAEAIAFVSGHVGLSAPQALGHSVPVVARADLEQGPEFECVIDGFTGRTYRSDDELAQILLDLATQPDKAAELGRAGLALYNRSLSADAMCRRMVEAVEYVVSQDRVNLQTGIARK
ncbi:MAG: glycosyltransferase family 4 protein [Mesorhizobium sp.]